MTVFLFFDESGNLDFSSSGTKYYMFGCLTTKNPAALTEPLSKLRYELLGDGVDIERFHASADRQKVRDRVFQVIADVGQFEFDAVIVEKSKVHPNLQAANHFYPRFATYLLQYVFKRYSGANERIVIITDKLPVLRKQKAVEKLFKGYIRKHLRNRPFSLLHHSSASYACLQASDYCMWAVYRKWQLGDRRSYDLVQAYIRSEFDILEQGDQHYY